jgi:glycosyltransferase involved in cell wall biosynthesis
MRTNDKPVICFITGSAGDWGGASRVLYTNLRNMDRTHIDPLLLLPRDGPIVPELQRIGLRYRIWGDLTEPSNPIAYAKSFMRALIFFIRERVALVHLNHRPWRPAEVVAARLLRIPVLIHYHVVNEEASPTDRMAQGAIAVSEYVRNASEPKSLSKHVVYNPVDLSRFENGASQRSTLGIDEGTVTVSFLGQIRDFKGVEDFIAMARQIDDPRTVFLIAGECRDPKRFPGSLTKADLERLIGADSRIRYLGYVERVENIYKTSDIVVVPSRWQEPLGLVAIEALACEKPVVATHVGGLTEIIDDGRTGYLVPPQDVPMLVDRVQRLIRDPALRQRMGKAGHEQVVSKFTVQPLRQFEQLLLQIACP